MFVATKKACVPRRPAVRVLWALFAMWGCGGGAPPVDGPSESVTSGGDEVDAVEEDGLHVEGLMGTLSGHVIEEQLFRRQGRFVACWTRHASELELLAGRLELYFHIDSTGQVAWVYPRSSTLGHRAAERCMVEVARATRFPAPRGGPQAEFAWSLELPDPETLRPPVAWDEARVAHVVDAQRATLLDCVASGELAGFKATAYVAPGGAAMAIGIAATQRTTPETLDCLTAAIAQWPMPDAGSYPGKVSFSLR